MWSMAGGDYGMTSMEADPPDGCQARRPLNELGAQPPAWQACGAPVTEVRLYACRHGHVKEGRTCDEHRPEPGEVGCSACWDLGHECPMTWSDPV